MRLAVFPWLGKEFVGLATEGRPGLSPEDEMGDILQRLGAELARMSLSLENTVRTRMWARDRAVRDAAGDARLRWLSGRARSASASYIAPSHLDSQANVAMELLAVRPSHTDDEKTTKEFEPQIVPVRYIVYQSLVFLSGFTSAKPTPFADQVSEIAGAIGETLADAGSSWAQVEQVSCFLHRDRDLNMFRELFRSTVPRDFPRIEYSFVDGYAAPGKLVEIEVTART